jgi:trehalose synthase
VVLHDPQTAGLAPALKQQGATVIWSCHVGVDLARMAWEFLRPAVQQADAYVFSRSAYCWEGLDRARLAVIAPCIDAFAPKNQPLEPATVAGIP